MLLLTFTAGDEPYGLDVSGVIEVVPRVELRVVPHAPEHLAGLLSYRGQVVPVVDLGLLLGSSASAGRLSTRIILVRSAGVGEDGGQEGPRVLGLIAERVIDLVPVEPGQVEPAPVHLPRAPYLSSVARLDRGFVPLIDVDLLSSVVVPAAASPRVFTPGTQGFEDRGTEDP